MSYRKFIMLISVLLIISFLVSCEKEPGPGGKSTLYGKVLVKDYNSTFTELNEIYYGPGIWVYLVFGNDRDYGERIQTGIGGVYEFKYLRPGKYRVYAFSKDSTLSTNAEIPVIREVEIPSGRQEIGLEDLVIFN
jgi:hypothetical protein